MTEKKDPVKEYLKEIGARGGSVKTPKGFSALTPEQRQANARKGAATRWAKKKIAVKKGKSENGSIRKSNP